MSQKKILLAHDFSRFGDAAVEQASVLARQSKAALLLVHVEQPHKAYGEAASHDARPEEHHQMLEERLASIAVSDSCVNCQRFLLSGDPAAEIVRLAELEKADLVVMGTHGWGQDIRNLVGSVTEQVLQKSPCPVLVVRPSQQVFSVVPGRKAATVG